MGRVGEAYETDALMEWSGRFENDSGWDRRNQRELMPRRPFDSPFACTNDLQPGVC
jgi:hypothetical protein